MSKQVIFESRTMPEILGYPDRVTICNESLLYHDAARCSPNPRKPWIKGGTPWRDAYGFVRPGKYRYECINHNWGKKYGKCLLIEDGGQVLTRYPNVNHGGAYMLKGVFVHKGWSNTWPGSAGCPTIPPARWKAFLSHFKLRESGVLHIIDYTKINILRPSKPCLRARLCPIYDPGVSY